MSVFEVVLTVVVVFSLGLAATSYFRTQRVMDEIGREGKWGMSHEEDIDPSQRVSEDEPDEPIPPRPLRGRPE
jgi:hypothetical protein